jgi:hypothetical protein
MREAKTRSQAKITESKPRKEGRLNRTKLAHEFCLKLKLPMQVDVKDDGLKSVVAQVRQFACLGRVRDASVEAVSSIKQLSTPVSLKL